MKKYVKPSYEMSLFDLNESITNCDLYIPVQVDCVLTMHHHIFYDNCLSNYDCTNQSQCDGSINYASSSAKIVTYNNKKYLVWEKTSNGGQNSGKPGNEDLLKRILKAGEGTVLPNNASQNWNQYHAGEISPTIQSGINASA